MKIARIRINNILGVQELELTAGNTITEFRGGNGTGKTSVLEAIKGALKGGHDATLLRKGSDKGEVVLVMDDADETQIHKKVTEAGSTTALVRDGKKIPNPATEIKALLDTLSVNPIEFLTSPPKDRVKVLLESMPIAVDVAKLEKMSGMRLGSEHQKMHALPLLAYVHEQIYSDRTGTNRAVKEKEATINQLMQALPELPEGVTGSEENLRAQVTDQAAIRDKEFKRIDDKLTGIRVESQNTVDKLKADGQAEIDAIRERVQKAIEDEKNRLSTIETAAGKQRDLARTKHDSTVEPVNAAIATIVANRNAFARREQSLATIREMEAQHTELKEDVEKQSAALVAIEAYKSELLANLPIPGLEVHGGELSRNGVAFDRLNTAQQVDIAIEIAKLRSGTLKVCCIDRFEALDPEMFEEFKQRAEQSDLQLFVTRVESGPFQIVAE